MRNPPALERAAPGDCPSGKQWYVCVNNSFTGCCSVDACDLPGCPDNVDIPSTSSSVFQTSSSLTVFPPQSSSSLGVTPTLSSYTTTASPPARTSSSVSIVQTSDSSTALLGAGVADSSTVLTFTPTGLTTSSSIPTGASSTNSVTGPKSSSPPIAAIAGGVVGGVILLTVLAMAMWLCMRRRKQLDEKTGDCVGTYGVPGSPYVVADSRPRTADATTFRNEVFAPFGGEHRSRGSLGSEEHRQPIAAILPISTPPRHNGYQLRTPSQSDIQSASQAPSRTYNPAHGRSPSRSQAIAISSSSSPNKPTTPNTPPRDPEKAALAATPPPEHEHPIYGLTDPHPGTPVNIHLSPIPSGISSSLSNLPVFAHNPTQAYQREKKYRSLLRRTSEVTRSTTKSRRYTDAENGDETEDPSPATTYDSPVPGCSELDNNEIRSPLLTDYSPPIPEPAAGHIELPAERVPSSFLSPPIGFCKRKGNEIRDSIIIPPATAIGLGVENGTPTSVYPRTPESPAFPGHVYSNSEPQLRGGKSWGAPMPPPPTFLAAREVLDGNDKEVHNPSPTELGNRQRWSGITAIGSRNGTPGGATDNVGETIIKRRREEFGSPMSMISVDVEREWGDWALR